MLVELENLEYEGIQKLLKNKVLVVCVRHFVNKEIAAILSKKIIGPGYENYLNAPSIGRIGMAFYAAENKAPLLENYFDEAFENIEELRRRCFPYASPIDLLRCKRDEVWPAGAHLETLYGRKMYVGLSRVVRPDVTFLAHHDIFAKDAPDSFHAHSLLSQLAANVYLLMPTKGGAIQIWDQQLPPAEFDAMRGNSYGIDPALLGTPTLEVRPNEGDLILFNSRCMHAVTPGSEKLRLSLSCFIGYRSPAMPLTLWS
ncbi:MAG: 2OG-Fe(II) oxygenase [Advenella sp.]